MGFLKKDNSTSVGKGKKGECQKKIGSKFSGRECSKTRVVWDKLNNYVGKNLPWTPEKQGKGT